MNVSEFKQSLDEPEPDPRLSQLLQALWQEGKANWEQAHRIVQALDDSDAAWVHAYLHRKEGDLANAAYWYRRAGKTQSALSLEAEWEQLASAFLSKQFN